MNGKNELPQLPKGWAWTTLKEIAKRLQSGGTPSTKVKGFYEGGTIPFVKIEDMVNAKKHLWQTSTKITEEGLKDSSAWIVPENSLLYSMYASYGIPIINRMEVATNQAIIVLIPPDQLVSVDYLYYLLWSMKPSLRQYIRGTTQENLNAAIVSSLPIALAPLPEQHRIVAKIEELFSDLDAGVAALQKIQTQLKRYRQAVLKAAVEGKLTAEWRAAHRGEIEPASALLERIRAERAKNANSKAKPLPCVDAAELGALPEGWDWVTLQELSWDAGYGTSVKCDYGFDGAAVLRIPNIAKGRIDLTDLKCASNSDSAHFDPTESLATGDLLIVRTNGSRDLIGRAALVSRDFDSPHYFASYLIRFRLMNLECLPLWINTFWDSTRNRAWIEGVAATTAGQYNVSMTVLNKMPVPLPPLAEQQQIVAEVERRLSVADEVERTVDASLKQAERLRQSILKRAFAGKLVPQDPNDEPAERLVERIRAARDLTGITKSVRSGKHRATQSQRKKSR